MRHLEYSSPDELERPASVTVHEVAIDDAYVTNAEVYTRVNDQVEELMTMGYYGDPSINLGRERKGIVDRDNPATKELMRRLPSFADWLEMVPTAGALDALYFPEQTTFANGKPVDKELASWLRNIADGRGIRARGAVVRELLRSSAEANPEERQSWLSLASGAAQPVIGAAADVYRQGGDTPDITLVDHDRSALALARHYAHQDGVDGRLQTKYMNILRPEGIADNSRWQPLQLAPRGLRRALHGGARLQRESYDVVEAVGIVEYLKPDDWKYTYSKVITTRTPMAGARTFLRNSYELVKPGGMMVIGNMLDTHPQLGFTLNVIQWPHIQPRSIEQMTTLFQEAGIEDDIDVYIPPDGVYALYSVRKQDLS